MVLARVQMWIFAQKQKFEAVVPEEIKQNKAFLFLGYVSMLIITLLLVLILLFGYRLLKGSIIIYLLAICLLGASGLITYFIFDLYKVSEQTAFSMTLSISVVATIWSLVLGIWPTVMEKMEMLSPIPNITAFAMVVFISYNMLPVLAMLGKKNLH